MRVPEYLAVAQWAVLIALGLLVIVVYRHLGRVLDRNRHTATLGPAPGSKAATFEYLRIGDGRRHEFSPAAGGQPTLIAFVDPTCPACEELVQSLGAAQAAGELAGIRVLLVTADPPRYIQISETFMTTSLELGSMTSHLTRETYNVTATPLLVAIDGGGVVRAAGPARQRSEVHAYVGACLMAPPDATLAVVPGNSDRRQEPEVTRSRQQPMGE